ncbi:MAG: LuxR C-terminal-related transcriptional regulator [Synergistaceae bacterium]|nr:LuxR C-terminal-related transcriptional regulator [Synergistaceae bacterium]
MKGGVAINSVLHTQLDPGYSFSFKRKRLNQLLEEAVKYPVVVICAATGYGKTRAVSDFVEQHKSPVAWMQLSERDNVGYRAWENYVHTFSQVNESLASGFREFGFPDTDEKQKQLYRLYDRNTFKQKYIFVLDDFHLIKDPVVLGFFEREIYYSPPNGRTVIIICRETPQINLAGLQIRSLVYHMYEQELSFTESEVSQYMSLQGLSLSAETLREIYQDTKGWAFALSFIAQSLKKSPYYSGYVREAMRNNFFQLMETELFSLVSEQLRHLLVRLSLIDHLSADLVSALAENDKSLLRELVQQNAYVRFDSYVDAYMIHHLFLDFLRSKQDILTEKEKQWTYQIAADWCNRNDFKVDALAYYEKIGDYESIVSIFFDLPLHMPRDIALYAAQLFDRAPRGVFSRVSYFAVMHVRVVVCLGKWQEALKLLTYYEAELLRMPEDNALRNCSLVGIYHCWGMMRQLMCTIDSRYDFHDYYARMEEYQTKFHVEPQKLSSLSIGAWFSLVGSAKGGAPQEYIDALSSAAKHWSRCLNGYMVGVDDLARGELLFYQGDFRAAESFFSKGLARAREYRQFELMHRALFYMLRIAVAKGDLAKAVQALKDTEALVNENEYLPSNTTYDITLGAYYTYVSQPEMVPTWLKEKFSAYDHTYFNENSANQVKAYYNYITNNYVPLLAYIEEKRRLDSILYNRVELGAMEACALFKTKEKASAFSALYDTYEIALPNAILTPFIWLGKDMRALAAAAQNEKDFGIPKQWLEMVENKSASFAKRYTKLSSDYRTANNLDGDAVLTPREIEVLKRMSHGESRREIAENMNLSISTVKHYINSIYDKLKARNLAEAIRNANERKLI